MPLKQLHKPNIYDHSSVKSKLRSALSIEVQAVCTVTIDSRSVINRLRHCRPQAVMISMSLEGDPAP